MKNLVILIILLLFFSSCDRSLKFYDEERQEAETSISVLKNIDTTYRVSIVNHKIYILQDSLVVNKLESTNKNDLAVIPLGGFLFAMLIGVLAGVFLYAMIES